MLSIGFKFGSGLRHWKVGLRRAVCMPWQFRCPMALPLARSARQAAGLEDSGSSPVQQGLGAESPCMLSDGHWLNAGGRMSSHACAASLQARCAGCLG